MTTPFSASITNPVNTKNYEISNALHISQQTGGELKSEIQSYYSNDTIDNTMFEHLIKQHEYVPRSNTKNTKHKTRRDKRKNPNKPKSRRPIRKLKIRKTRKT